MCRPIAEFRRRVAQPDDSVGRPALEILFRDDLPEDYGLIFIEKTGAADDLGVEGRWQFSNPQMADWLERGEAFARAVQRESLLSISCLRDGCLNERSAQQFEDNVLHAAYYGCGDIVDTP